MIAGGIALLLLVAPAGAQLPPGNAQGVSTGHVHLRVPDVARHKQIWMELGGVEKASGRLELIEFPGIFVLLAQGDPEAASRAPSAKHVGFSVRDYPA